MLTNPTILTPPTFADITHKTLTTCVDMKIDASKHPINSQAARLSSIVHALLRQHPGLN